MYINVLTYNVPFVGIHQTFSSKYIACQYIYNVLAGECLLIFIKHSVVSTLYVSTLYNYVQYSSYLTFGEYQQTFSKGHIVCQYIDEQCTPYWTFVGIAHNGVLVWELISRVEYKIVYKMALLYFKVCF